MGAPALGSLSKALNRFNKIHLYLLALACALLFLSFWPRSPDSGLASIWRHAPRPHQAYISSKAETNGAWDVISSVSETNPVNERDGNVDLQTYRIHELGDSGNRLENPTKYL